MNTEGITPHSLITDVYLMTMRYVGPYILLTHLSSSIGIILLGRIKSNNIIVDRNLANAKESCI